MPASSEHGIDKQWVEVGQPDFADVKNNPGLINHDESDPLSIGAFGYRRFLGPSGKTIFFISPSAGMTSQPDPRRSIKTGSQQDISWIGLSFSESIPDWLLFTNINQAHTEHDKQQCALFTQLLELGSMQINQLERNNALLNDPLTGLACRTKFQSETAVLFSEYSRVAVLMVHSGDFHHINKKFGHESGDKVIWEIAKNLQDCIRETDVISRFAGALFAVAVPVAEEQQAVTFAHKIQQQLQNPEYLGGAISLGFDVGVGCVDMQETFDNPGLRVAGLINKADQALKASQANPHPTISLWQAERMDIYSQQIDYIGGIFTADTATDYRNMLLLWDISNIIAGKNQFDELLFHVIQRLGQTFDFQYAGIVESTANFDNSVKTFFINEDAQASALATLPENVSQVIRQIASDVSLSKKPHTSEQAEISLFASPLSDEAQSCFFLVSDNQGLLITNDSQMLFTALSKQLGRALNRTRLEEQLNNQLQQQKQQLQHELEQLKHDLQSSSMFYCSNAMEQLMKQAKRTAMTDTTTLIIGESGTGKERLVKALHKMGNRKEQPLVVVDCGAIPENLIESELFGYVKGAFTGAQNTSKGKVFEADGGTLMLDEIGELPLQMQTKLLRFVQEKHYTPVGGSKPQTVDVKIIAVTNRELEQEVLAGNFRQDLFYRLNVLTLRTPPLRERPEDIMLLSKHFLKKFSQQFSHSEKRLSDDANKKMAHYHWPGNIRELENKLMQANLLCEDPVIHWKDLKIDELSPAQPTITKTNASSASQFQPISPPSDSSLYEPPLTQDTDHPTGVLDVKLSKTEFITHLQQVIRTQLLPVFSDLDVMQNPLGSWLEDDLILLTYKALGNNMKKAGLRLGVSHSTLRRRIEKISHNKHQLAETRPAFWPVIADNLQDIAHGRVILGTDCLTVIKLALLEVILALSPNNMSAVSVLMGMSEPTMYKFKKQLLNAGIFKSHPVAVSSS